MSKNWGRKVHFWPGFLGYFIDGLMSNHVHLLMKEIEEPILMAIKRICGSYVYWYNMKWMAIKL